MIDAAVIVPRPAEAQVLHDLGMKGSATEIPDPIPRWYIGEREWEPDGWWLTAGCYFAGPAHPRNSYDELASPEHVEITTATAAICTVKGRMLVIVSPHGDEEPAVWIAVSCSRVAVETSGSKGLRGRPSEITLSADGWQMKLIAVNRLYRRWQQKGFKQAELIERQQAGQEASLVKAIADAATVTPSEPVAAASDAPAEGEGYEWQPQDSLGGIFRLRRQGEMTTATSLVDRELPIEQQVRDLEAVTWVPRHILGPIIKATREDTLGKLWIPELPPGRVSSPLPYIHVDMPTVEQEETNPVRRYLWPVLGDEGALSLDLGEEVAFSWEPDIHEMALHSKDNLTGIGRTGNPPTLLSTVGYMTDRRIVLISRRSPEALTDGDDRPWHVTHFRWEWVSDVGTVRISQYKRSMLRSKKTVTSEIEGFYLRIRSSNGSAYELRFLAPLQTPGPDEQLIEKVVELIGADPQRTVGSETRNSDEKLLGGVDRRIVPIEGSVPLSLPEAL